MLVIFSVERHVTRKRKERMDYTDCIGLYRENAMAIESEAKDPFGGNVPTRSQCKLRCTFARKERNLHCDVVHITTKCVFRLTLDHAIAAIQTSR